MFMEISQNIIKLYGFLVFFIILMLFFYIILKLWFFKFDLSIKKIKVYTLFLKLNNLSTIALSSVIISYFFIIWNIFFISNFNISYLVLLIILAIIFNICLFNYTGIFFGIINSVIQYISILILNLLIGYLIEVRFTWYVLVMSVLLGIFLFAYSTYFLLKHLNDIIIKER